MWNICDINWFPQCKVVIISALINLLNTIWFSRNQARYNNKIIPWQSAISLIIANTYLLGNNMCKATNNSIRDFTIMKHFKVSTHQPRAPIIKEIRWHPPLPNWKTCNIDGAFNGNPGISACGGIFKGHHEVDLMCCFSEPLGITSAYHAELCGAMRAIKIAHQRNWSILWLETDSALVVLAFKKSNQVPWSLRNRWNNVSLLFRKVDFIISHIYREGNKVADSFANLGLTLDALQFWNVAPDSVRVHFVNDRI